MITDKQRNKVAKALGFAVEDIDNVQIINALADVEHESTEALKKSLKAKQTEFKKAGGRGVKLAEEIDSLRIVLAVRSCPAPKQEKPDTFNETLDRFLVDSENGDAFLLKLTNWLSANASNMNISGSKHDIEDAVNCLLIAAGEDVDETDD